MSISVQENQASLTIDGKSWDDISTDSGDGLTIDQLTIADLEGYGFDLPDIDDNTHILIGYDDGDAWLYIEDMEPIDLGDFDLGDLDLDWELDTLLPFDDSLLGVDDDFNIYEEELPDHIEIVTLPSKLKYVDGEVINIFGMRVVPKKSDDSTWTNSKYFRGYIPLQELIIDPTHADAEKAHGGSVVSPFFPDGIPSGGDPFSIIHHPSERVVVTVSCISANNVGMYYDQISDYSIGAFVIGTSDQYNTELLFFTTYSSSVLKATESFYYGGKTVYFNYSASGSTTSKDDTLTPSGGIYYPEFANGMSFNKSKEIAWTLEYGEYISGNMMTVTVTWNRYGDGKPLSATFDVEVIETNDGGGR